MPTREQWLGSFKLRYRTVDTLAGRMRIRNLTEGQKSAFEAGSLKEDGKPNLAYFRSMRRRLICEVAVDDAGQQLFQPGDEARLKELDAAVTAAIFDAATEHCGFTPEEVAELEKNCAAAGGDDSPTG